VSDVTISNYNFLSSREKAVNATDRQTVKAKNKSGELRGDIDAIRWALTPSCTKHQSITLGLLKYGVKTV
jgi:hypothetical protein